MPHLGKVRQTLFQPITELYNVMEASILVTGAGLVALWSVATNQAWPGGGLMAAKG